MSQRHHSPRQPQHPRQPQQPSRQTMPTARMQALDQRCFVIYIEMARLRTVEKALTTKWQLWHQQRMELDNEQPQAFVQGIISAFGGPRLFPDAQNWHYRNQNLQRSHYKLVFEGTNLQSALSAYEAELYLINLEMDMLISFP